METIAVWRRLQEIAFIKDDAERIDARVTLRLQTVDCPDTHEYQRSLLMREYTWHQAMFARHLETIGDPKERVLIANQIAQQWNKQLAPCRYALASRKFAIGCSRS